MVIGELKVFRYCGTVLVAQRRSLPRNRNLDCAIPLGDRHLVSCSSSGLQVIEQISESGNQDTCPSRELSRRKW